MIIRTGKTAKVRATIVGVLSGAVLGLGAWLVVGATPFSVSALSSSVVYDATPTTLPPNVASLGYQATSTAELGDAVTLAGTDRTLTGVTVTMSNWALYSDYAQDVRYSADSVSWTHPVTVNVYSSALNPDGTPSTLLATTTQSIAIPWRPAADPTCAGGTAYRATDGDCYNGIAFNAAFDFSAQQVTLPDDVIVSVAYNTGNYGATPLGINGPYNSLNVGIPASQVVSVGTDVSSDALFWNTTYPGYTAGLKQDTGWTPNGTVALKITATTPVLAPTTKDQCKNNGWKTFNTFKNQGDCVSSVVANSKSNR